MKVRGLFWGLLAKGATFKAFPGAAVRSRAGSSFVRTVRSSTASSVS